MEGSNESIIALADRCIEKAQQMARDCLGELYRSIMLGSVHDLRGAKSTIIRHGTTEIETEPLGHATGYLTCSYCIERHPCADYIAANSIIVNWASSWKLTEVNDGVNSG